MNIETIGLIAATPQETAALLRCIQGWKRTPLGTFRGFLFQRMDRSCLVITSGMGLQRAMAATRALLAATRPQLLVSFGIAGAVQADLHIGDVVVASSTCRLDTGLAGRVWPLASFSKEAWEAAADALQSYGKRLVAGTALTTRGSQAALERIGEMPHPVLEMETAGIAQVAAEMRIPLVCIRSISDGPEAPIPFDLESILDDQYNLRPGKMLRLVLRRPQIVAQSRRIMQNSRIAADHAARAVVAVLSQPSQIIQ